MGSEGKAEGGTGQGPSKPPLPPFSQTVWFQVVVGVTLLIVILSVISYSITAERIERNGQAARLQTEENLADSIRLTDAGVHFLDLSVNVEMEDAFGPFLAEYNRSGGQPELMDLEGLKRMMDGRFEFYLIDPRGVIVATTFPPDLGLNFSEKAPYFQEYLASIRSKEGFYPDQLVYSLTTGQYQKYAYMPSPDHKYILELGLKAEYLAMGWALFTRTMNDKISSIRENEPSITSIRLFDLNRNEITKDKVIPVTDPDVLTRLNDVIATRESRTYPDPEQGSDIRYLFVDCAQPEYGSDTSRVFQITYSRALVDAALRDLLLLYITITVLALLLSAGVALLIARRVSEPVDRIVRDVDRIAGGDLDHTIRGGGFAWEFMVLEEAINRMVGRLRETITRLREREEALGESEARYRAVVEGQIDLILQLDPDGTPAFMNDAFCRYFGVRREDALEGAFSPSFSRSALPLIREAAGSLTPESPVTTFEAAVDVEGEPRWLQFVIRAIFDEGGKVRSYLCVARDQTVRHQAEEALIDARDFLSTVLDTIPDPVFVKDREHRYIAVNDAFCEFRRRTREEILGRTEKEVFAERNAGLIWEQSEEVFLTGVTTEVTWELQDHAGGSPGGGEDEATFRPARPRALVCKRTRYIDMHGDVLLVGILHDISREKEAEEAIRRINEELERRVRERTRDLARVNADLESFCYSVSHDLRSPLRAIDGYLGIYSERFGSTIPQDGVRYIASARQNVVRMANLIDDLLALSRAGRNSLHIGTVDCAAIAREVMADLLATEGGRTIHFVVGVMPPCQADPALVRQVYDNLLSNALKFTRKRDVAEIEVGSVEKDGKMFYFVRDNGIGFDMRHVESAFGIFQRLHAGEGYEGTGIGLALARRIISVLGGEITVEAAPDKGATFFFTFGDYGAGEGDRTP